MQASKVENENALNIITYNPEKVKHMVEGIPFLELKIEFESMNSGDARNNHFMLVQCPNEEITIALGNLLRKVDDNNFDK